MPDVRPTLQGPLAVDLSPVSLFAPELLQPSVAEETHQPRSHPATEVSLLLYLVSLSSGLPGTLLQRPVLSGPPTRVVLSCP